MLYIDKKDPSINIVIITDLINCFIVYVLLEVDIEQ